MQLVLTLEAERDLERITDFVGVDGSAAATAFLDDLRSTLLRLAETPEAYPIVPRYRASAIRRRVFGKYLIFYRARAESVTVLRVLHGARDYDALLSDDSPAR